MISPHFDFAAPAASSRSASVVSSPRRAHEPGSPTPAPVSEIELVELVRRADAGEPAAQTELVRRYSRRLAGFVRTMIRQPDAIEDVTQMVFIKMFRRLNRLRDPEVFESWLFTLARNTSLDFLRRRRCRPNTVPMEEQLNEIADPANSQATAEILAALDRALERLSPLDRSLITQFVAGDSYGEIAERSGLSLATVKVRLHRMRPFLRASVGEMTDTRLPGPKSWNKAGARRSRCASVSRLPREYPVAA